MNVGHSSSPYNGRRSGANDDELVEVTPQSIRLRKSILDHNMRKRFEKKPAAVLEDA